MEQGIRIRTISLLCSIMAMWLPQMLSAQYVVINNSNISGNSIPFQDTIISSLNIWGQCTGDIVYYSVDLDQDLFNDVDFVSRCYWGGKGGSESIAVSTQNNFSVHIDTSYQEYVTDTILTTTVVKKYTWGDTIYDNQNSTTTSNFIHLRSWATFPSPWVFSNINLFKGETSYIAFTKNDEAFRIYYIKIHVQNGVTIQLISAKTNDPSGNIDEATENANLQAYPNPFTTSTTIEYELIEPSHVQLTIYNAIGETIYVAQEGIKQQGKHTFTWSPESLPEGMYYGVLRSEEEVRVVKMIKQ